LNRTAAAPERGCGSETNAVGACVNGDVTRIFDAHLERPRPARPIAVIRTFPNYFLERDMEEFERTKPVA
jgi:hypothetical protein